MKKTAIVIGAMVSFAYAAFIPPDGVSKMPVKNISVQIDSPYLQVNAELSKTSEAERIP